MDYGKERRCWRWCCTIFGLAVFAVLVTGTRSFGQSPTTVFQLDGNSANSGLNTCTYSTSGQPCDYWNLINGTGKSGSGVGHSMVNTFIPGSSTTYSFTGGGSKDSNLISQWAYSSTGAPNKDTINAAYAAAYTSSGQFYLIFGADRLSPSGDANIGIWFFQQDVHTNSSGGFAGAHQNGDLFLISQFTNGGGTSVVAAYEWDSSCNSSHYKNAAAGDCADTNLRLLSEADASKTLGITNSQTITATWASYSGGQIVSPLFFEGGVNLQAIYGSSVPCFASFLVETRSSQSTNAVLKDFLLGGFPVCGLSITKTCSTHTPHGTYFEDTWTGTVCNTGAATLSGVKVTDKLATGTITYPPLSSTTLGPKGSGSDCATFSVSTTTTSTSITNTASANAKSGGTNIYTSSCSSTNPCGTGYTCVSNVCEPMAQASCSNSAASTVSVVKHCVAPGIHDLDCSSAGCVVLVPISAQVCNQSTTPCYGDTVSTGCSTDSDCSGLGTGYACVSGSCRLANCPPLNMTCGPNNYCVGAQLTNIQLADSPAVLSSSPLTPNGFSLNPGDCTGGTITDVACGGANDPACPTGYTCETTANGSFCKTPPNPTGKYKPTSYENNNVSTGNSNGRFLFQDTISVTSATATIGENPPAAAGCPAGSDLACSGVSCPLCPYGECSTDENLP